MIYRKSAKAFDYDKVALKLAKQLYESGEFKSYKYVDRIFLLLPFEHSENIDDGNICLELVQQLYDEFKDKSEDFEKDVKILQNYAIKHLNILMKFGRYPHRNEVLGRESTPEEIEYLKDAERFGQ